MLISTESENWAWPAFVTDICIIDGKNDFSILTVLRVEVESTPGPDWTGLFGSELQFQVSKYLNDPTVSRAGQLFIIGLAWPHTAGVAAVNWKNWD